MWELNYNIHDLLTMKICSAGKNDPTGSMSLRYSYFATSDGPENPDITLNIGPFAPSHEGAEQIAHKYFVKENYFYCKEKGSKSKWEIEIFGFETGKTHINFNGGVRSVTGVLFPTFLAQEFLIPIIEYKLARKKHFLLHGGAVCNKESGIVLIGRGGVWKTSLIMDFMRTNQYKFLGEDRIILKDDGSILSFPRAQFVFDYTLSNTMTEERNTLDNIKILFHVLMKKTELNLIAPIVKCKAIKKIVFVSRKTNEDLLVANVPPQEGLQKIITNNMAEYIESTKKTPVGQYYNYVQIYSLIFPNNDLLNHNHRLRDGLQKIVMETPMSEILLPFTYDGTVFKTFNTKIIENNH
jgi:hypothetical protein